MTKQKTSRFFPGRSCGLLLAGLAVIFVCVDVPANAASEELPAYPMPDDAPEYKDAITAYNNGRFAEAFTQFRRLAELGHGGAEFMLGVQYFYGRGTDRDYSVASIWFYKSARQGNAAAQLAFGSMFIRGVGVSRDPVEAYKWLTLASASDIERIAAEAAGLREQAAKEVSAEEIAEAKKDAARFEAVRTGPLGLE